MQGDRERGAGYGSNHNRGRTRLAPLTCEVLECRQLLTAVPFQLAEISVGHDSSDMSTPLVVGSTAYFFANDAVHGRELWRTDGTEEGTTLVKDINPGAEGSGLADGLIQFAELNGAVYFWADDGEHGAELWRSDGTTEGTALVRDFFEGSGSGGPYAIREHQGQLVFLARDNADGVQLWGSDGSTEGTELLNDFLPGSAGTFESWPDVPAMLPVGETIYFRGPQEQLWKTDGTASGTALLKDFGPGRLEISFGDFNGRLAFTATSSTNLPGLWVSDGTPEGTQLVKSSLSTSPTVREYVTIGETLFFTNSTSVWKSDGTDAGTAASQVYHMRAPENLVNFNGTLYYLGYDSNGHELWRTDGTKNGTVRVTNFYEPGYNAQLALEQDGRLLLTFATSYTTVSGWVRADYRLWLSDGTGAGTFPIGPTIINPDNFAALGSTILFRGGDFLTGDELWSTNLVSGVTARVKDINSQGGKTFSRPRNFTKVSDEVFFVADDWSHGEELWKTDGTPEGTVLVKDIYPGVKSSSIYGLTNLNGTLYFQATDPVSGRELWKSDGTTEGTQLFLELQPGTASGRPANFAVIGERLYFTAGDQTLRQLWSTDGTVLGSTPVTGAYVGRIAKPPMMIDEEIYFNRDESLWKTDGTVEGTVQLKQFHGSPYDFVNIDGRLYFRAWMYDTGTQFWTTDGTAAGTLLVKDLVPDYGNFPNAKLEDRSGKSIFSRFDLLWTTDGTPAGTRPIFSGSSWPTKTVDDFAFFVESLASTVRVHRTDGTAEGTVQLAEFASSNAHRTIEQLVEVNGTLFFLVNAITNVELWASDGSPSGTVLVMNLNETLRESGFRAEAVYLQSDGNSLFLDLGEPWMLPSPSVNVDLNGERLGHDQVTRWLADGVSIAAEDATLSSGGTNVVRLTAKVLEPVLGDLLWADTSGTLITASFDGTTLTLWGEDTQENYEQVLRSIRFSTPSPGESRTIEVQAFNNSGFGAVPKQAFIYPAPQVTGRYLFYNNSAFDGGSVAANATDDGAIATDKVAFLSGSGLSTTASVSSYVHGINGVMIDIANLDGQLTADDFTFRMGTSNSPESWTFAPAPLEVIVRAGAGLGGSDRVTITWADWAIKNTWLQVVVEGNDAAGGFNTNTELTESDVFYFGSRVGDTFVNALPAATVTSAADELGARFNPGVNQPVTSVFDFNRDGVVNAADQLVARNNAGLLLMIEIDETLISDSFADALQLAAADDGGQELAQAVDSPRWWLAFALAAAELEEERTTGLTL